MYLQEIDLHIQDSVLHSGTAKGVRTENYWRLIRTGNSNQGMDSRL